MPRVSPDRQRIIDFLETNGPIEDRSGRATGRLKEAVGYDRSDAGFSQLVGAMDRDGDLVREIRGKKTYKISVSGPATISGSARHTDRVSADESISKDVDYDELAAALLARVQRIITREPVESAGWARRRIEQLEGRIDELQKELLGAKAEARANAEERDELRGQLEAASRNLDVLAGQGRAPKHGRAAERLGSEEQALLYQLRAPRDSGRTG